MFITQITSCQACGALWPQFGRDPRRVQTWKWVCSPACSTLFLAQTAGLVDVDEPVDVDASYAHRRNNMHDPGEAPLMVAHAGALPPAAVGALRHDYREQIERAVDSFSLNEYRGS